MADLLGNDTDYEMDKYLEANLVTEAGINPAIEKNKKSVFNTETNTHDILMPMSRGGYIKIGEEGETVDPPKSILIEGMEFGPETPEFQRYYPTPQPEVMETAPASLLAPTTESAPVEGAVSFANERMAATGAMPTMEDFDAAGYTPDVVEAAGLMGPQEDLTLSPDEIARKLASGEPFLVFGEGDPTIREAGTRFVEDLAVRLATEGMRAELLEEQGVSPSVIEEAANIRASVEDETDPSVIQEAEQRARSLIEQDATQRNAQVNFRTIDETIRAATGAMRSSASVYSNALFGTGETNPLQVGVADFATFGALDIQEGYRMFNQSNQGAPISPLYATTGLALDAASSIASAFGSDNGASGSFQRLMGLGLMTAGLAEATVVGKPIAALMKKGFKVLEPSLIKAGAEAEQRIAQEGSTMFSNPVGPIVDRGLAAAGRLVAPKIDTLNDFVSLASKGQMRQARTTQQNIDDIMQKKMPATEINMRGASEDLSIAYESGEITDQLEKAGLFVEDDRMGTIFVGTTQENLDAIKTAKTPAEIGKLSGYSDADIAAFYLKRRGGDKESAFDEYSSDLNSKASGRLVAPKQSEVDAARLAYEADPNNASLKQQYFDLRKQRDENPVESVEPPTENKPGMIVFHGSGADFDKFEIDKINTGEGAQAYGYGLYFTDSEDIARFYKSAVRQGQDLLKGYEVTYKGKPFANLGDTAEAESAGLEYSAVSSIIDNLPKIITVETQNLPQQELLELAKNNLIETKRKQQSRYLEDMKESEYYDETLSPLMAESFELELKSIESVDLKSLSYSEGKTYQVELDVGPDELLDYDKSFEEQSPLVQQAVMKTLYEMTEDDAVNFGYETVGEAQSAILKTFTTKRFLNDWAAVRGSDDAGEKLLERHGVKGIRYKASRGSGDAPKEGPSNYVVFDDKLIQIMKKYGIVGPVSLAAVASNGESKEGAANGI